MAGSGGHRHKLSQTGIAFIMGIPDQGKGQKVPNHDTIPGFVHLLASPSMIRISQHVFFMPWHKIVSPSAIPGLNGSLGQRVSAKTG